MAAVFPTLHPSSSLYGQRGLMSTMAASTTQLVNPGEVKNKATPLLTSGQLVAVIASSVIIFVCMMGCITLLFIYKRRPSKQLDSPETRNVETGGSLYTQAYHGHHRKNSSDIRGMTPLLKGPSLYSRRNSEEMHAYHDGHSPPFINSEENIHHATSFIASPTDDASMLGVTLPPFSIQSPEDTQAPNPLPSRKPPRSKQDILISRRSSNILDPGIGYLSDDSDSMYSQLSTSLLPPKSNSRKPAVPLSPIPQSPANFSNTDIVAMPTLSSAVMDPERTEEENRGLGRNDTVLVASLLKSRQEKNPNRKPPTRSSTLVSHIERQDSIKPRF